MCINSRTYYIKEKEANIMYIVHALLFSIIFFWSLSLKLLDKTLIIQTYRTWVYNSMFIFVHSL